MFTQLGRYGLLRYGVPSHRITTELFERITVQEGSETSSGQTERLDGSGDQELNECFIEVYIFRSGISQKE